MGMEHLHCDNSETGRRITYIDRDTKRQITGVVVCHIEDEMGDAAIVRVDNSINYVRISTYLDRWWYTHDSNIAGAYINRSVAVKE